MSGNSTRRAGDRGSSAVEFSLVVAAMAAMIVAVVMGAGQIVGSVLDHGCESIATQTQADSGQCGSGGTRQRQPGDTAAQDDPAGRSISDDDDPWAGDLADVPGGA